MSFFQKNDIIEMAVKIEQQGFSFYEAASKREDIEEKSRKLFRYLRDEEKKHEKIFRDLRDAIDLKHLQDEVNWQEESKYIESTVNDHIFSDPQKAIQMAAKAKNAKELINFAIAFEKDTMLYFHSIRNSLTEPKAKAALNDIINEEISHLKKLEGFDL